MRLPIPSRTLLVPIALATVAATLLTSPAARAAGDPGGVDLLPILAGLVLILVGARLGGALFEALRIARPHVHRQTRRPLDGRLVAGQGGESVPSVRFSSRSSTSLWPFSTSFSSHLSLTQTMTPVLPRDTAW